MENQVTNEFSQMKLQDEYSWPSENSSDSEEETCNKGCYQRKDSRKNIYEIKGEETFTNEVKNQAHSIACMISISNLEFDKDSKCYTLKSRVSNLNQRIKEEYKYPLGEEESFQDEPAPGHGTAFLVTKNTVLTAAHCICKINSKNIDEDKKEKTRFIFDFQVTKKGSYKKKFNEQEVYTIKEILKYQLDTQRKSHLRTQDWALIKLDREVEGANPLVLDFSTIKNIEEIKLYMLGHPCGLPLKMASGGQIIPDKKKKEKTKIFYSNLDAFHGNSGSPVFDEKSQKVIGILCSGDRDFIEDLNYKCDDIKRMVVANYSKKDIKTYEKSQKINSLFQVKYYIDRQKLEEISKDMKKNYRYVSLKIMQDIQLFFNEVKDVQEVVQKYTKKAEQGDSESQLSLGLCYNEGVGFDKDFGESINWYEKAALQENAKAQYNLGVCYSNGRGVSQDEKEAAEWYKKAAQQGNATAQYSLGWCYEYGVGVIKDEKEAAEWYKKAAQQGLDLAQYALGVCYEKGIGVSQDEKEVVKWFTKSALQGNTKAQFNVGVCYKNGRGVIKNEKEAAEWYKKAALQGNAEAQFNLGVLYEDGIGVIKDEKEAAEWYKKAALQGCSEAQNNLGLCYANGMGVIKDEKEAAEWYKKAALQGLAQAQYNLGWCYENGVGVIKDEKEAAEWYKKAALQGNSEAQNNLGVCYEYGIGVTKDWEEAVKWYNKAANQGHVVAQNNLEKCIIQ